MREKVTYRGRAFGQGTLLQLLTAVKALLRRPRMSALQPLSGAKRTSAGGRPPAPSARRSPVANNVKTLNFLGADYLPCHVPRTGPP